MSTELRVLGLCGSLRAGSFNRMALLAAGELMPEGMTLEPGSFAGIPIYSADDQTSSGFPEPVLALGRDIARCDGVLIASPEYNFSIPGGLKNAIDWVSRLPDQPFKNKPVAILGASTGPMGTGRMQYDMRRVMHFVEAQVLLKPEIFIGQAAGKFDAAGQLTDATTRKLLGDQMIAFSKWIRRAQAIAKLESGQA